MTENKGIGKKILDAIRKVVGNDDVGLHDCGKWIVVSCSR